MLECGAGPAGQWEAGSAICALPDRHQLASGRRGLGRRPARKPFGRRADAQAFLDLLARHGDPAVAADHLGVSLTAAYRQRDADPVSAAQWQAALGYAWEQVENRVLAAVLRRLELEAADPAASAKGGVLDSRLALAIVTARDRTVTRGSGRPADGASVARLRAELRALAQASSG